MYISCILGVGVHTSILGVYVYTYHAGSGSSY